MLLRNLDISSKLTLMILCAIASILAVTSFSLYKFRDQLYEERKAKVQHQVEVVHQSLEQLAYLRNEGCERAQGYLISKPLSAEKFTQLLQPATSETA